MANLFLLACFSTLVLGVLPVELSPFHHFLEPLGSGVSELRKNLTTIASSMKLIEPSGCTCEELKCECCTGIFNSAHKVCLYIDLEPNELKLQAGFFIDDNAIYNGTIDTSSAPICIPNIPGVCLVVNHVNIDLLQVCTKMNYSLLTFLKFPCTHFKDGKLSLIQNKYR